MEAHPRIDPVRALGPLLFLTLLALGFGLRWQAQGRSARLLAAEERALERTYSLYRASRAEVNRGVHPGLEALISEHAGLAMVPELCTVDQQYAADAEYMYALTRPTRPREEGRAVSGFILRSWPLRFGVSGDREFYADDLTGFWQGQNEIGRSGTEEAFPPPFPEPDLEQPDSSAWWQTSIKAQR